MDIAPLFDAASTAFDIAFGRHGKTLHYLLGGRPVRVRIAGPALAEEVDLPLSHLRGGSDMRPEMTVDLWSEEETGVAAILGAPLEEIRPFGHFTISDDRRYLGEQRPSGAIWYDRERNRVIGSAIGLRRRALDERARPFHRMFCLWLSEHGIQFVHSGLIARKAGDGMMQGVLFVGVGGSGKTTSSISCFRAGLSYLGDDAIGLECTDKGFVGHSLYGSCLVDVDHIRRFPDLEACSLPPRNDFEHKAVVYLTPIDAARMAARVPITAVVLPRIVDRPDTTFRPASRGQALLSMAPSSIMSLPIVNHDAMERVAGLIESVPSYWLELGRDVGAIPGAVNALFDALEPVRKMEDR
jgi:hypothetical protein